jgi:hypothetical protein
MEVLSGATILAVALSVSLYCTSFIGSKTLAASGTSGYLTYDFWMGRELNPRTGRVDWKEFCELTPGLIGWACINLAFAHKQFVQQGHVCFFRSAQYMNVYTCQLLAVSSLSAVSLLHLSIIGVMCLGQTWRKAVYETRSSTKKEHI